MMLLTALLPSTNFSFYIAGHLLSGEGWRKRQGLGRKNARQRKTFSNPASFFFFFFFTFPTPNVDVFRCQYYSYTCIFVKQLTKILRDILLIHMPI